MTKHEAIIMKQHTQQFDTFAKHWWWHLTG